MILENHKTKLVWDFQFNLQQSEKARRQDLILKTKSEKQIRICDKTCPMQQNQNIDMKQRYKLMRYQQLAFEKSERGPRYTVTIVPEIIGVLDDGMKNELIKLVMKQEPVVKTAVEMQKTILLDSERLFRIVLSGLSQSQREENKLFS